MKRAGMTTDFKNDQAIAFGAQIQLMNTKSRHYTIPIRSYKYYIKQHCNRYKYSSGSHSNKQNKNKIAQKLYRQIAHPSSDKLLKLLNSAGDPWKNDEELIILIKKIV